MRSQVTKIALAVTLATALIDAAPASAQHGKYSLALATGHELPWPTATHAQTKQNYNYYRESGYRWDPWGHWGSYYGPMIH